MRDGIPTRLLRDAHGAASRPRPGDTWDVVFVRNDGWSLAAPAHLRDAARKLWEREWVEVIECPGTRMV